uniref:Uncharacterized protein n=1 Tax=Lepeophtheirus salmonis TaxID=72036 RepID=A0A0K2V062_LEPSM
MGKEAPLRIDNLSEGPGILTIVLEFRSIADIFSIKLSEKPKSVNWGGGRSSHVKPKSCKS